MVTQTKKTGKTPSKKPVNVFSSGRVDPELASAIKHTSLLAHKIYGSDLDRLARRYITGSNEGYKDTDGCRLPRTYMYYGDAKTVKFQHDILGVCQALSYIHAFLESNERDCVFIPEITKETRHELMESINIDPVKVIEGTMQMPPRRIKSVYKTYEQYRSANGGDNDD